MLQYFVVIYHNMTEYLAPPANDLLTSLKQGLLDLAGTASQTIQTVHTKYWQFIGQRTPQQLALIDLGINFAGRLAAICMIEVSQILPSINFDNLSLLSSATPDIVRNNLEPPLQETIPTCILPDGNTGYQVSPGDYVYKILDKLEVPLDQKAQMAEQVITINGLDPAGTIYPEQCLQMPDSITLDTNTTPIAIDPAKLTYRTNLPIIFSANKNTEISSDKKPESAPDPLNIITGLTVASTITLLFKELVLKRLKKKN